MATSVLWRKLDSPGHDACRLRHTAPGWLLEGTTVFLSEGVAARVDYEVVCDAAWQSRHGRVQGWIGDKAFDVHVVRTDEGVWQVNGAAVPGMEDCVDLDFSFTPATNFLHLRRIALREGEAANVPVAWLCLPAATLELLPQRYERRGALAYWYEAPTVAYSGLLELNAQGFTRRYPGLWEMES